MGRVSYVQREKKKKTKREIVLKDEPKKMNCKNENCLFNKKHICTNDYVSSETLECFGKDKVQGKVKTYQSIEYIKLRKDTDIEWT